MASKIVIVPGTPLDRLIQSGVMKLEDGALVWREGHLEAVMNAFIQDREWTKYNYADELDVLRAMGYSAWGPVVETENE